MKLFLIVTALIVMVLIYAVLHTQVKSPSTTRLPWKHNRETIYLEIADDGSERSLGLSGRDKLATDGGMIFRLPHPQIPTFWMSGVKFPLDIIWIRDKVVIDLTPNIPAPKDSDETKLQFYQPREPVDEVIELNAGMVEKLGITIGDRLNY